VPSHLTPSRGPLTGIRAIELADEQAEYCGLTLAGLGADVVKALRPNILGMRESPQRERLTSPHTLELAVAIYGAGVAILSGNAARLLDRFQVPRAAARAPGENS
jgi:crotonobetainyl-CoA:carnitine CoA-transferase CaiB-like acyl-CoA transferase